LVCHHASGDLVMAVGLASRVYVGMLAEVC
jgi:hypothetical protein